MTKCIMTVCTADCFQYYIPIFVYSILNVWDDVDVVIYLRGELDNNVDRALKCMDADKLNARVDIIQNYKVDYPHLISTTNSLRFVTGKIDYDEVFVTDIDFFFIKTMDLFTHCRKNKIDNVYCAYHGPMYKPHRPEICESWTGAFTRVAAGFVMLYSDWWLATKKQRTFHNLLLQNGEWGSFRESDEVMLYRIIRDSGLTTPSKTPLPRFLRPVHLGDFKPTMRHRYTNEVKMRAILDNRTVNLFLTAKSDPVFVRIRNIVSENAQIREILDNAFGYCEKRIRGEL